MGAERELTTVLLVHPDAVVHELVSGTLGDEFRVIAATSGARALTLFERHRPTVVVLESDIGGQRAEDLFEEMRRSEPELRAVFFADGDDPTRGLRLAELGTVLAKRRDVERLRAALRNAVRFRALSEDVARLKDDAARAGTTTARREQEEAAAAGPRSKRTPAAAPKRSPSLVDVDHPNGPHSRPFDPATGPHSRPADAIKTVEPASTRAEPREGPESRTSPQPDDDKRGRR